METLEKLDLECALWVIRAVLANQLPYVIDDSGRSTSKRIPTCSEDGGDAEGVGAKTAQKLHGEYLA